ncbi:MAG TPA: AI-2E family transporter [Candidatus Saccharimonadia bacterium]|jgi:predicted PurR-regulated permease PerM
MELTVSNRTIIRIVFIVIVSVLAVRLGGELHTQIVWILTALFLALGLEPAVDRLSRYMPRRSRGLAVGIVLLAAVTVLAFILVALLPPFGFQLYHLVVNLPAAYEQFAQDNPGLNGWLNSVLNTSNTTGTLQQLSHQLLTFGGAGVMLLRDFFGGIVAIVTILILTFFMVLEGPKWIEVFWSYYPEKTRNQYRGLLRQLHGTVTGYVNGNLVKSLIAILASVVALLAVGSPYALALALLVGILDLIPMVGATLAAVTVCLVVLVFKGVAPALIMLVFFVVFQQFENYVFQPIIFARAVEVSPLVTMLALIIGASLGGFIGALVAIPVAASLQILVKYWMGQRRAKG